MSDRPSIPAGAALVLALLLFGILSPAFAETLDEAWVTALAEHRLIAAAEAQRESAEYALDRAKAEHLPRVDVTSAYTQLDAAPRFAFGDFASPKLFSSDNVLVANAQVTLPLYTGGQIASGIDAASSFAEASRHQQAQVIQDIKLGTAERFIDVLRAESRVVVADSNVTTLESQVQDARAQYELGSVPKNDYLAATVSLANAKQRQLQARNQLELARAAYNRYLGRPMTAEVVLDSALRSGAIVADSERVEALVDRAVRDRHELSALALEADSLRAQSRAERAAQRPRIALTGGFQRLENQVLDDDEFWSVGVAVQWSPFDSGRIRSQAASLDRQARAVSYQRADLESLIALEVRQAWLNREEAAARQQVADAAVAQAVENLRVVRDRYKAGAGTNTEVLDAESLRALSLSNRDNARFDLAIARLRLARAVGAL
jgi:outer membrane protein TolC